VGITVPCRRTLSLVTHILEYFEDKCVFVPSCCTPFIVWDVITQFRLCCRPQLNSQLSSYRDAITHHLNLPEAFTVHPQPILSIPGKFLIAPATCYDTFFYFTTPITVQSSVTYTANPKVGN
jgi:hypothetical protein